MAGQENQKYTPEEIESLSRWREVVKDNLIIGGAIEKPDGRLEVELTQTRDAKRVIEQEMKRARKRPSKFSPETRKHLSELAMKRLGVTEERLQNAEEVILYPNPPQR